MIEVIFLVAFGLTIYHIFRILNNQFSLPYSIVSLVSNIIILGLFLMLTSITLDPTIAIYTNILYMFVVVEFILLIIEVLINLGYIAIKTTSKRSS